CAADALYGLEERLQAKGYAGRAFAGKGPGDAVWAHVSEAGDKDHCREFAASQGAGRADTWRASGSADQEAAAEEDCQLSGREPVSGKRISAGVQPTLCPGGGKAGGLSRAEADGPRTA